MFAGFDLNEKDIAAVKSFLDFPLKNSAHPAALLISHNSFAIYLAEKILGCAFVKKSASQSNKNSKNRLVAAREIFERVIFLRMRQIYSPAEIAVRTASQEWMRGADACQAQAEKKRLANN